MFLDFYKFTLLLGTRNMDIDPNYEILKFFLIYFKKWQERDFIKNI